MPGKLKTGIGQRLIFEMRLGGVLEFACEKGDDSSGEAFDRRAGAAGRQVHFAPLCDAGGACGRDERSAAFFCCRGLSQLTRLHGIPGRGSESGGGYSSNNGARSAGIEIELAGAGCREFRDDDAAAFRDFGGAGICVQADRRCVPAEAADETRDWPAAGDGRGNSRA